MKTEPILILEARAREQNEKPERRIKVCPYCGSSEYKRTHAGKGYHCTKCRKDFFTFSIKVVTDSRNSRSLPKWLTTKKKKMDVS